MSRNKIAASDQSGVVGDFERLRGNNEFLRAVQLYGDLSKAQQLEFYQMEPLDVSFLLISDI